MTAMWSGEAQAYYDLCQGCDGIVEGGIADGRFVPFRGKVADNGEVYCVGCWIAKAVALAPLAVLPC